MAMTLHGECPCGDAAPPNVPADAMGLILRKITSAHDAASLLSSCKRWRDAAVAGAHTFEITDPCFRVPSRGIVQMISDFHSLTSVSLSSGCFSGAFLPVILLALSNHENLRILCIRTIPGNKDSEVGGSSSQGTCSGEASSQNDVDDIDLVPDSRGGEASLDGSRRTFHGVNAQNDREAAGCRLFAAFDTLFKSCTNLQELKLQGSFVQRIQQLPVVDSSEDGAGADAEVKLPAGLELGLPRCLPPSLGRLSHLRRVHLGPRLFSFHSLPLFSNIPLLQSLTLPMDCGVASSHALRNLPSLTSLNLIFDFPFCIHSFCLPASIGDLTSLNSLGILCSDASVSSTRRFRHLDRELQKIPPCLRSLSLHGVPEPELPDCLGALTDLRVLGLSHCYSLQSLPASVALLQSLEKLELTCNYSMQALFARDQQDHPVQNSSLREVLLIDCQEVIVTCEDFTHAVLGEELFQHKGRYCHRLKLDNASVSTKHASLLQV